MRAVGAKLRGFFNPHIPGDIRDEFLVLSAAQLQTHSRLLFLGLLLTTPMAAIAASPGASLWIRLGAPAAMAFFCLAGYLNLRRDLRLSSSARRARRFIRESTFSSSAVAVLCSSWSVWSWFGAPPGERIYYAMIVALGAFSTAYCVASARMAAIANLAINLLPMCILLFASGERLNLALGVSLVVAALFQLHMIHNQQGQVVSLLSLQRRARDMALSDPLTGLLNRRALLDTAVALGAEHEQLRLLIIDIDHFKAINDSCGHDMGDEVLCEVAERLAIRAEIRGSVARLGGEEFAILGRADELPEALALAVVADIRNAAMPHGRQVTVSVGVAEGTVGCELGWRALYRQADTALYAAKSAGRNRVAHYAPAELTTEQTATAAAA